MRYESANIHMFHFIMDEVMKGELLELEVGEKSKNLSGVIVRILTDILFLLDKEHFRGVQRGSRYRCVTDDPDVLRKDVFVYMPEWLYKRLKIMHQDLNVFSIAQLVREFLGFYLELVRKYKKNTVKKINELRKKWFVKIKRNRLRFSLQQFLSFFDKKYDKFKLLTIYDDYFCPAKIWKL